VLRLKVGKEMQIIGSAVLVAGLVLGVLVMRFGFQLVQCCLYVGVHTETGN